METWTDSSGTQHTEVTCPSCLDNLLDPRVLPCGHVYCGPPRPCLRKLQNESGNTVKCLRCHDQTNSALNTIPELYPLQVCLDPDIHKVLAPCIHHEGQLENMMCTTCEPNVLICSECWFISHLKHKVTPYKQLEQTKLAEKLKHNRLKANLTHLMNRLSVCDKSLDLLKRVSHKLVKERALIAKELAFTEINVGNIPMLSKLAEAKRNDYNECDEAVVNFMSSCNRPTEISERDIQCLTSVVDDLSNFTTPVKKQVPQAQMQKQVQQVQCQNQVPQAQLQKQLPQVQSQNQVTQPQVQVPAVACLKQKHFSGSNTSLPKQNFDWPEQSDSSSDEEPVSFTRSLHKATVVATAGKDTYSIDVLGDSLISTNHGALRKYSIVGTKLKRQKREHWLHEHCRQVNSVAVSKSSATAPVLYVSCIKQRGAAKNELWLANFDNMKPLCRIDTTGIMNVGGKYWRLSAYDTYLALYNNNSCTLYILNEEKIIKSYNLPTFTDSVRQIKLLERQLIIGDYVNSDKVRCYNWRLDDDTVLDTLEPVWGPFRAYGGPFAYNIDTGKLCTSDGSTRLLTVETGLSSNQLLVTTPCVFEPYAFASDQLLLGRNWNARRLSMIQLSR